MAEPPFSTGDVEDDLPRTVRREKEARARDQMARDILNAPKPSYGTGRGTTSGSGASMSSDFVRDSDFPSRSQSPPGEGDPPATVTRIELPFGHMVVFFLKAVVAAIPALLLLVMILGGFGWAVKKFIPSLAGMEFTIGIPQNAPKK